MDPLPVTNPKPTVSAHVSHGHSKNKTMNHGALMSHNMTGMCKMDMYWNWYTIDACFLSRSWHISSAAMFAGSCVGIVFLVVLVEALRRGARELDRYIVRDWKKRALAAAEGVRVDIVSQNTAVAAGTSAPSLPAIPQTDGAGDEKQEVEQQEQVATTSSECCAGKTETGTKEGTAEACAAPQVDIPAAGAATSSIVRSSQSSEMNLDLAKPAIGAPIPPAPKKSSRSFLSRLCPYPSNASGIPRPTIFQQLLKSLIYAVLVGIGYILMLLVMYYNGYIFVCLVVGAWLGNFLFGWDTCMFDESVAATGEGRSCGC
ncbi:hypothetical protein H072_1432 [Dactylellina haptotyla CBS 200.50]|uniref:Copper transport protein n=1 Tax=Dactylellina haptotyla (strain CBS 200.50) TaxID=1284197 RepID=S8BYL9_DACHA|nr:hypothetical protein H072_1432 [Dactylellina haptotyla CBS 200.50]